MENTMKRRAFFSLFGAAPLAVAAVPESVPAKPLSTRRALLPEEIVQAALVRMGSLQIGRYPAPEEVTFALMRLMPGMDDADLAKVLAPYYPTTADLAVTQPVQYGTTIPQMCVKCGGALMAMSFRFPDARRIMQCSGPGCENHHPWVQNGYALSGPACKPVGQVIVNSRGEFWVCAIADSWKVNAPVAR
jgi:hypothetical protein